MLKAFIRWLWPQDAVKRNEDTAERYITRAEFDRELEAFRKEADWLFDEWHTKFSTLHARLTKATQRRKLDTTAESPSPTDGSGEGPPPLPSALAFRRPWSV